MQDSGASEGPSGTVSSHATAAAAVLRLMERALCPPVNSNQLSPDAAKPGQAQKASPQGTRPAPAAAGKPPGQVSCQKPASTTAWCAMGMACSALGYAGSVNAATMTMQHCACRQGKRCASTRHLGSQQAGAAGPCGRVQPTLCSFAGNTLSHPALCVAHD